MKSLSVVVLHIMVVSFNTGMIVSLLCFGLPIKARRATLAVAVGLASIGFNILVIFPDVPITTKVTMIVVNIPFAVLCTLYGDKFWKEQIR